MRTLTERTYFTLEDCGIELLTLVDGQRQSLKLADLLTTKYKYNWITFTDSVILPWETNDAVEPQMDKVTQWINRFSYIFDTTKGKYLKVLELYEQEENNLLHKIGSETTTKFNDTPQNAGVGETDDYTTTVSKTATSVDPGEMITRLENIRKNLRDMYALWADEFEELFGESTLI